MALFYKAILNCCIDTPDKTSLEGLKKVRETMLVGGNAAGEKLKPFIIVGSENPHALRGVNKETLHCYYGHSN